MTFHPTDLLLAWILDALLGDPEWIPWPHPVVLVGRACSALEVRLRRAEDSRFVTVLKGALLWGGVVGGCGLAVWVALGLLGWFHPLLQRAATVYLAYACLATRSLDREAREIGRLVETNRLDDARVQLSRVVGRDTAGLASSEVLRGAMETTAENSSDGVVAPLFYLALGGALGLGPTLGVAYKAVNTLDSMVGYRNEQYEVFGKASARLDDVANWLPARLTVFLVAGAAWLLRGHPREALEIARRDGPLHKSPNSGYPEAAFAGALGVQLGGTNWYQGVSRVSPPIGNPSPALTPGDLRRALRLLWAASGLAVVAGALVLQIF